MRAQCGSWRSPAVCGRSSTLLYSFEDFSLDTARRELRRGGALIALQPQVFDLLEYAIRNRERVVSKDDLLAAVWNGRIVSESTLSTRINAARSAIGDSGEEQRLIRTAHGKGIRFAGVVREGEETVRKLAAIFAADVAGYSRLMGQDEIGTLRRLTACRAILDERIAAHRGRIFGSAGDSVVADFASAVDAVQCAVAVQEALAGEEQMRFRIGVHVGDVIVQGDNLFGDGVNIAARLEVLAEPVESASRGSCATRSATSCPMPSRIWESRASRISHGPCASMQLAPVASGHCLRLRPQQRPASPPPYRPRLGCQSSYCPLPICRMIQTRNTSQMESPTI